MSSKSKKIIITFGIIIVLAAIGAGAYFGLKQTILLTTPPDSSNFPINTGDGNLIPSNINQEANGQIENDNYSVVVDEQKQRLIKISNQESLFYWIASSTKIASDAIIKNDIYYINSKGDVIKVTNQNNEEIVVSSDFGNILFLEQSISGEKIVVGGDTGKWAIFDITKKIWTDIDKDIISATISPDGKKVAYLKEVSNKKTLYTKDYSKAKPITSQIQDLYIEDIKLEWSSTNNIFLIPHSSVKYSGQIWLFNLAKKTIENYMSGSGISSVISPIYGPRIKFIANKNRTLNLYLLDKNGKEGSVLPVTTISDKCGVSLKDDVGYCAVPYVHNKGLVSLQLPDDFYKKSVYFKDWIYKIDFSTGAYSKILDIPGFDLDAINLKERSNQLFFINRLDDRLYMYNLE